MPGGFRIARIFGIPIYLHPTWFIVFLLVTLGLSSAVKDQHGDWSEGARYAVAATTAVLFFVSIILHELGHSVLALRHRVPVRSITLFVFGGVAVMEREPENARAEFEIAIAGPIVSALLGLLFVLLHRTVPSPSAADFVCGWLARINLAVAIFNLLPGFPLDGGRVLRAVLWARTGDVVRATRVAAGAGQFIAYAFIALGALQALLLGGLVNGLWLAFIGWFLLSASGATIRQVAVDASLRGLQARDLMAGDLARIDGGAPVARFARELVMRGRRWALVEEAGGVVGLVTLSDVKRVDPDEWETTPVRRVATPVERLVTATPDTPVRALLTTMSAREVNQIPVVEAGRIVGAVTRDALVHAIDVRQRAGA